MNADLPDLPVKLSTFGTKFRLPATNSFFRGRPIEKAMNGLHDPRWTELDISLRNAAGCVTLTVIQIVTVMVRGRHFGNVTTLCKIWRSCMMYLKARLLSVKLVATSSTYNFGQLHITNFFLARSNLRYILHIMNI